MSQDNSNAVPGPKLAGAAGSAHWGPYKLNPDGWYKLDQDPEPNAGSAPEICPHGHDLKKKFCGFCRYASRPRCIHGNHSFCGFCGPLPNAEVSDRRAQGNDNTTGANGGSLH